MKELPANTPLADKISADLDKSESISSAHIAEAIQYRSLDRESWAD